MYFLLLLKMEVFSLEQVTQKLRSIFQNLQKNNSAVICEIMNEDGTMAKGQELFDFANKHGLKIGKIEDLIAYRLKKEKLIRLKKQSFIEVKKQKYKIRIYENLLDGSEHFALIKGTIKRGITQE